LTQKIREKKNSTLLKYDLAAVNLGLDILGFVGHMAFVVAT
jgi:hypothetical protein